MTTPGLPAKVAVREGVIARHVAEDMVILDLTSGEYFSLNGVGAFIWKELTSGRDAADVAGAVTERYEVDPSVAAADVGEFITDLVDLGLLSA